MEVHGKIELSQFSSEELVQRSVPLFGGAAAVNAPPFGSSSILPRISSTSPGAHRNSDIKSVLELPSVICDSFERYGMYPVR